MNNSHESNKFKELLDKLQQESWQLELLISGFAIFGLLAAIDPIGNKLNEHLALETPYITNLLRVGIMCCYVLIINLILHVILRGLWIGAIGLRYVSNEIDYEELKYNKRFTKYLKRKVGSFDGYIATLENYCSILFAVAFLSLFYIIAFFNVMLVIVFGAKLFIGSGIIPEIWGALIFGFFVIFYLLMAFVVFIDFVTQGFLKKKEWSSFLFMPLYKFFNIITLSFLYRPLVYNFLDNKFGRRILRLLLPIYIVIFYITTSDNIRSNFLKEQTYSSNFYSANKNYLHLLEDNEYVKGAAIDYKIISKPYFKLFIPLKEKLEDKFLALNKELKPKKDKRGFKNNAINIRLKPVNWKKVLRERDSISTLFFKAINKMYVVKIDTTTYTTDFIGTKINKQLGFETILPLKSIKEGKHTLTLSNYVFNEKTKETSLRKVLDIPFWYYKE
ncbi:MAG: hypothetical protein ACPGUU_07455 [Flavobacteriaceae bacterium]